MMMDEKKQAARDQLKAFKGDSYVFGLNCFDQLGRLAADFGRRASVVMDGLGTEWGVGPLEKTKAVLSGAGIEVAGDFIAGARPNTPTTDLGRITDLIADQKPDFVIAVGGGSVIDSGKASVALVSLRDRHPDIEEYFGTGVVTAMLEREGRALMPMVAVQLAASSGAHLTKYSNITDPATNQKKLIVDEAIIPRRALFDYAMTTTSPQSLTADGGLDGIAHSLEVFYGVQGDALQKVTTPALLSIDLVVQYIKRACADPEDLEAREALGLGTDLGGYAIMIGGTNGAHLTSFSLVDILSHGRACYLMNPYYTIFFAPAIQDQLHAVGKIYKDAGYTTADVDRLSGRDLGVAVADAMIALAREIDLPTTLNEVPGFTDEHVKRALSAAKNPQLEMKLKNMPVALSADLVDDYMAPILEAAKTGDHSIIKNMA